VKAVDFTDDALNTIKTLDKVNGATKSSLSAGRRIHHGYKAGDDILYGISKEVTRNRVRADFVDEANKIIYELKPNNPRGLRQGIKTASVISRRIRKRIWIVFGALLRRNKT